MVILDVFLVFRDISNQTFDKSADLMRTNDLRIQVKPILIEYLFCDLVHIAAFGYKGQGDFMDEEGSGLILDVVLDAQLRWFVLQTEINWDCFHSLQTEF